MWHAIERGTDPPGPGRPTRRRGRIDFYGRAALQLGYDPPAPEFALSQDIDAVFWLGQAEALLRGTNFWTAIDAVNRELERDGLFISPFFEEDQVILTPEWREQRVALPGSWTQLRLFRLGDGDLFLSKLMRDDPQDQFDARFIWKRAAWSEEEARDWIRRARIPRASEIHEEFEKATVRLFARGL